MPHPVAPSRSRPSIEGSVPRRRGPVLAALAVAAAAMLAGCSGFRLVIEPVPAPDTLERRVIDEHGGGGSSRVAMVSVEGFMVDAPRGGLLSRGENPVARLSAELREAADDDRVKAVVLRISTRGGTVTASDMMHREVMRFRSETGKPVVGLLGEVAASGGYYLACACDVIVAHPTTITGSIGVITQTVQFGDALERLGIHADAVTSGPNKAMASPFGSPDAEHRAILQELVDDLMQQFVSVVEAGRPNIDRAAFDRITDGRVFTGQRAVGLGLVDELGDGDRAFALARDLAGVQAADLVRYVRPGQASGGRYASGSAASGGSAPAGAAGGAGNIEVSLLRIDGLDAALLPRTSFHYLWAPGAS